MVPVKQFRKFINIAGLLNFLVHSMFTDLPSNRLMKDAEKITKTSGGKSANFRSSLIHPVYLSYRRAPRESGIDRLAVTDMCIIIPAKHETCPPAFNQVADSLNSNPVSDHNFTVAQLLLYPCIVMLILSKNNPL